MKSKPDLWKQRTPEINKHLFTFPHNEKQISKSILGMGLPFFSCYEIYAEWKKLMLGTFSL